MQRGFPIRITVSPVMGATGDTLRRMHHNQDHFARVEADADAAGQAGVMSLNQSAYSEQDATEAVYRDAMRQSLKRAAGLTRDQRRLDGSITPNRSSRPTALAVDARPTKAEQAWMLGAEQLAHDLLRAGVPDTLAGQAEAFATFVEPAKDAFRPHGLDRRGAVTLEAAARHLIHHVQPANLTFASADRVRTWRLEQWNLLEELPGDHHPDLVTEVEHQALERLFWRPRVLWAHADGLASGLLIDRFHHSSLRGLVARDTWVHRKVAEDLTSVAALLRHHLPERPPAVLGVRVIAHRRPNSSLHFPARVAKGRVTVKRPHALGACKDCVPARNLPNQRPAAGAVRTAEVSA